MVRARRPRRIQVLMLPRENDLRSVMLFQRRNVKTDLAQVACALACFALALGSSHLLFTVLFPRGLGSYVLSTKCLEPMKSPGQGISPFPTASNPFLLSMGIPLFLMMLLPWEWVRGLACMKRKRRLFRVLSVLVIASWFPPVATWWDEVALPATKPLEPTSAWLKEVLGGLQLFDVLSWSLLTWPYPWTQLIPLFLVVSFLLEGYREEQAETFPQPSRFQLFSALKALRALIFLLVLFGVAYKFVEEIAVLHAEGRWARGYHWRALAERAVPFVAVVLLQLGTSWLLASKTEQQPHFERGHRMKKVTTLLSAMGYLGFALVILALAVHITSEQLSLFPRDVVLHPRHATGTACPFISSRQLLFAQWLLIAGFFLGELVKVILQELIMGRHLWCLMLQFQVGIVLPLALSFLWPGFRIVNLLLRETLPPLELVTKQLQHQPSTPEQWVLVFVAALSAWRYRSTCKKLGFFRA